MLLTQSRDNPALRVIKNTRFMILTGVLDSEFTLAG